nr:PREDICTED: uncharacterized protein LOC109039924 [Bemisia tabaci]
MLRSMLGNGEVYVIGRPMLTVAGRFGRRCHWPANVLFGRWVTANVGSVIIYQLNVRELSQKMMGSINLGTEHGILKSLYTRSQFTVRHADLISLSDVPNKEVSLREAATTNSVSGGQGFKRCNCRQKCTNNRCACRAAGLLCNSKCHKSEACTNK